jgi:hypothetical protein
VIGFLCTDPAGWEAEDVGSLLAVVALAAAILAGNRLLGRRWGRTGVWRAVRLVLTLVLVTPLCVAGAFVIWLAPC